VGHPYAGRHLCPELFEILAEAYEQAVEGEKLILPRAITEASNLRTTFTKIITRTGLEPWPRLFQNLRASRASDWVEKYPNHVVAKWLGHSPMITGTHYLQTRERHFEAVVAGGGALTGLENAPKSPRHRLRTVCTFVCSQKPPRPATNRMNRNNSAKNAKRCETLRAAENRFNGRRGTRTPDPLGVNEML
jgi:hypothetical protein